MKITSKYLPTVLHQLGMLTDNNRKDVVSDNAGNKYSINSKNYRTVAFQITTRNSYA